MFESIKKIFSGKPAAPPAASIEAAHDLAHAPESALGAESSGPIDLPLPAPAELKLEALFTHAAHEAGKRNDFLAALMVAELFVIGSAEPADNGAMNIQLATQTAGEEPVALAFTSQAAMAQAGSPTGQPFVKLKTQDLMHMIRGQLGFVLNPGNRVAKHFSKVEIEQMTGAGAGAGVREMPMPDNTSVSIGQPAEYPPGLREALAKATTEIAEISAIHLGLMSVRENEPPVLLAVISPTRELGREDFLALVNQLGSIVAQLGPIPLNFAPMNPNFRELVEKRALLEAGQRLS